MAVSVVLIQSSNYSSGGSYIFRETGIPGPPNFLTMFLVLQYPLTDLRKIIPNNQRLKKPQWPNPDEDASLRHFGTIAPRAGGGVNDWPGEQVFCISRRALRIEQLTQQKLLYRDHWLGFKGRFRRFFRNDGFMGKFEMGLTCSTDYFANSIDTGDDNAHLPTDLFDSTIRSFLGLKVSTIDVEQKKTTVPLYNAGAALAHLYLTGSTKKKCLSQVQDWWVMPGKPLLFVVYENRGKLPLPPYAKKQQDFPQYGITLYSLLYPVQKNKRIKCWLVSLYSDANSSSSRDFLRRLRINLFRINAEKETLRQVLNQVTTGGLNVTDEVDRLFLEKYLEDATSKLLRKVQFGIDQFGILEHALYNEDAATPGELETLLSQLEPLKNKFIQENLKKLGNTYNLIGNFQTVNISTQVTTSDGTAAKVDVNVDNDGHIDQLNTTEKGNIIITPK